MPRNNTSMYIQPFCTTRPVTVCYQQDEGEGEGERERQRERERDREREREHPFLSALRVSLFRVPG